MSAVNWKCQRVARIQCCQSEEVLLIGRAKGELEMIVINWKCCRQSEVPLTGIGSAADQSVIDWRCH